MNKTFLLSPTLIFAASSAAQAQVRWGNCYWCQRQPRIGDWESWKRWELDDQLSSGYLHSYCAEYKYDNDLGELSQSCYGEGDCYSSARYIKMGNRIIEVAERKCGGASKQSRVIRGVAA